MKKYHSILKKPIEILLVEDNYADVRLIEEAFNECEIKINLNYVMDGEQAIKYINKEEQYSNSLTPNLILLDLNLPKKSGLEVLKETKSNEKLKEIPIIILSTSTSEKDIKSSYHNLANAYIAKPIDLDTFMNIVKMVENFWLTTNQFP